jgi:hypothetical protein
VLPASVVADAIARYGIDPDTPTRSPTTCGQQDDEV